MLSEPARPAEGGGPTGGAHAGPRHAAPRKRLLTKLQMPAGKAVALAAMPTAVLMGMGFTPHLAQADEPKTPFKPGPCVTRADSPTGGTAKDSVKSTAKPSDEPGKKAGSGSDGPSGTVTTAPTAPAGGPVHKDTKSTAPKAGSTSAPNPGASTAPTTRATTAPSPSATKDPWDPLGLGGLLNGLLGGGTSPAPTPTPAPTPGTTTPPAPAPTTAPPSSGGSGGTSGGTGSGSGGTTGTAPGSGGSTSSGTTAKHTAGGAHGTVKKAVKGLTDAAGTTAGTTPTPVATDGSQSYPCPTYDAKAVADASTETGIPLLPDQPWTLKSSMLTLHGLNYDGIVQVRTWSGQVKDVLKFTATGVDIKDLWQTVDAPGGGHTWVKARAGSTSTIRNGTVTMYTESLSGNLLGIIPITFTPKAPPPLTLPELFFTDVTVVQAGQFGGDLHVPGMQVLPGQA